MKLRRKIGSSTVVLIALGLAMACIWAANVEAASLRAGVAVQDITSDAPTKNIHDPLCAKALVLDDGTAKVVIISADIGSVSGTLVAEVRRRVQEELGINQKNVLLNASHNHHTWNQTAEDMAVRIVQAVEQAASTMVPVKIGVGVGYEDRISMNRRIEKNGRFAGPTHLHKIAKL